MTLKDASPRYTIRGEDGNQSLLCDHPPGEAMQRPGMRRRPVLPMARRAAPGAEGLPVLGVRVAASPRERKLSLLRAPGPAGGEGVPLLGLKAAGDQQTPWAAAAGMVALCPAAPGASSDSPSAADPGGCGVHASPPDDKGVRRLVLVSEAGSRRSSRYDLVPAGPTKRPSDTALPHAAEDSSRSRVSRGMPTMRSEYERGQLVIGGTMGADAEGAPPITPPQGGRLVLNLSASNYARIFEFGITRSGGNGLH